MPPHRLRQGLARYPGPCTTPGSTVAAIGGCTGGGGRADGRDQNGIMMSAQERTATGGPAAASLIQINAPGSHCIIAGT
jgi:hypothetical protein